MTSIAASPEYSLIAAKAHADGGIGHANKVRKRYGDRYPLQGEDPKRAAAYIRELRASGQADRWARERQATRNMLYLFGTQHITYRHSYRRWEELPLYTEGERRVTLNYILPVIRARTQRLTAGPVQFECAPATNAMDERDRAKIASNFLQARYHSTHMREKTDQALTHAFCAGVAFWKSFWNTEIGPLTPATYRRVREVETGEIDVLGQPILEAVRDPNTNQPIIDEYYVDESGQEVPDVANAFFYRPGDTDTAVRSVYNIQVNPDATGWSAGAGLRYLIDTDIVAMERARALIPDQADQIQRAPADAQGMTLERLAAGSSTSRSHLGPLANTSNRSLEGEAEVIEYWQLPDECFPKGRLIHLVGDVPVYDDKFPQGIFPYTPVFDEPVPMTPNGRPCINDMVSPQDTVNRMWAAIDAEIRAFGFARWAAWDMPGLPEQLTAGEDQTVVRVSPRGPLARRSLGDAFKRLEPGSVGSDRWELLQQAKQAIYDVGAFHEVSRGQTPPGVDSGVAIEHLREEEKAQLLRAVHALENSHIDWSEKQLAIARWGYADNVARWIPVDRPDLGEQLESVTGAQLPDPQTITVSLEGFTRSQSSVSFRAEIKDMLERQIIDPRTALQLLDMGRGVNAVYESESRHYIRARRINQHIESGEVVIQPPQPAVDPEGQPMPDPTSLEGEPVYDMAKAVLPDGTDVVLPDDDDHLIHMKVLDELVLDLTKDPQIRALAGAIKADRRRIMSERAMAAAAAQPVAA